MKKFFKNNKGFTLVELIVVVAVIAVLTAVAAPQYIKYVDKAADASLEAAALDVLHMAKTEAALGNFELNTDAVDVGSGDDAKKVGTITVQSGSVAIVGVDYEGTFGDEDDFVAACKIEEAKSDKKYVIYVYDNNAVKGDDWGVAVGG